MDANTALVLAVGVPITALAVAAAIAAKYEAEREKLKRRQNRIHPIAQIYRQMNGLDIKDSDQDMESLKEEIKELRQQISSLRDTSTQYDMSIDHHLRDLDVRLASVEKSRRYQATASDPIEAQSLPLNTGG
jgi:predicted RNase H-like nuclease (RuvC/YqgF family)